MVGVTVAATWGYWHFSRNRSRIEGIRNVLLVSIDTCRADHLSCYGYSRETTPNIDAVARDGVLFKSAVTPVPITLPAHCSMLTGTYPWIHGVRLFGYRLGDATATLASMLQAAGYQTAAFVGAYPLDSGFGLNRGFKTYNDQFSKSVEGGLGNERKAEDVTSLGMTWLENHRDKPFFLFLHYFDPHFPYAPPPPFASTYANDPYAGEIAYVDTCLGQIFNKLRALGIYDNTLVIITGDHGEGLGEHGELQHGFLIYQSTLHVPLIIRVPQGGVRGSQVDEHVSLVDIVPTVLSLIGLKIPQQIQGVDLRGYLEGTDGSERRQPICAESFYPDLYECSPLHAIVDGFWKYIRSPKPELYDLSRDGGEKVNAVNKEQQVAQRLQTRLEKLLKGTGSATNQQASVSFDKDSLRRLESLGYVGGGIKPSGSGSDLGLEDPKDWVAVFEYLQTANHLFVSNRYKEAEKECLKIVSLRPKFASAHTLLGTIALKEGRAADAIRHFSTAKSLLNEWRDASTQSPLAKKYRNGAIMCCQTDLGLALILEGKLDQAIVELRSALRIDPEVFYEERSGVESYLGLAADRQGKLDEAITHYREALKIKPDSVEVCYSLGLALARRGQVDDAIAHYRKALALQPNLVTARNDLGVALAGRGQFDEAIANYRKALAVQPQYAAAQNNLAWLLATCPEVSIRNGAEAVDMARGVVRLSGRRDPASLDTLAAAYAEAQQFSEAVATAQEALALARSAKQATLASGIQSRLDMYRAGHPYRETLQKTSPASTGPR